MTKSNDIFNIHGHFPISGVDSKMYMMQIPWVYPMILSLVISNWLYYFIVSIFLGHLIHYDVVYASQ